MVKSTAEIIVYGALDPRSRKKNRPVDLSRLLWKKFVPWLEVKARRVGGATYQITYGSAPIPSKMPLAMRWLVDLLLNCSEKTMALRLQELLCSWNGKYSLSKTLKMYGMAEANKAFSHYRFSFLALFRTIDLYVFT